MHDDAPPPTDDSKDTSTDSSTEESSDAPARYDDLQLPPDTAQAIFAQLIAGDDDSPASDLPDSRRGSRMASRTIA